MDGELVYNDELTARKWALNSAVECHPHTVEVIGSNPIAPTIFNSSILLLSHGCAVGCTLSLLGDCEDVIHPMFFS